MMAPRPSPVPIGSMRLTPQRGRTISAEEAGCEWYAACLQLSNVLMQQY
jgi:hypothetical protein